MIAIKGVLVEDSNLTDNPMENLIAEKDQMISKEIVAAVIVMTEVKEEDFVIMIEDQSQSKEDV